ncbi:hypothetical protein VKT23_014179 [Stygiomarasmius scandens]|uniref:Uncharacterized protein n=1 Tax=Marasmiellus scandens TaxID=2682957 RepID=A0ABR1J152_9AGAR
MLPYTSSNPPVHSETDADSTLLVSEPREVVDHPFLQACHFSPHFIATDESSYFKDFLSALFNNISATFISAAIASFIILTTLVSLRTDTSVTSLLVYAAVGIAFTAVGVSFVGKASITSALLKILISELFNHYATNIIQKDLELQRCSRSSPPPSSVKVLDFGQVDQLEIANFYILQSLRREIHACDCGGTDNVLELARRVRIVARISKNISRKQAIVSHAFKVRGTVEIEELR